jgi:hypothetical protein
MILIFSDLFVFAEIVCQCGVERSKETSFFKTIKHVLSKEHIYTFGVPYYCLFDNKDYIDSIEHDLMKHRPVYDDNIGCFLYYSINDTFQGIYEILKKLAYENPNDHVLNDKYTIIKLFMEIVENDIRFDDLCDIMKGTKL